MDENIPKIIIYFLIPIISIGYCLWVWFTLKLQEGVVKYIDAESNKYEETKFHYLIESETDIGKRPFSYTASHPRYFAIGERVYFKATKLKVKYIQGGAPNNGFALAMTFSLCLAISLLLLISVLLFNFVSLEYTLAFFKWFGEYLFILTMVSLLFIVCWDKYLALHQLSSFHKVANGEIIHNEGRTEAGGGNEYSSVIKFNNEAGESIYVRLEDRFIRDLNDDEDLNEKILYDPDFPSFAALMNLGKLKATLIILLIAAVIFFGWFIHAFLQFP